MKKKAKAVVRQKAKATAKRSTPKASVEPGAPENENVEPVEAEETAFDRVGLPPYGAPQVAIFGAGITGLTAAHELIERGYQVEVFEKDGADPVQRRLRGEACAVGGVARTQWASINATTKVANVATQPVPSLPLVEIAFTFVEGHPTKDVPSTDPADKIRALKYAINAIGPDFKILVQGHSRIRSGRADDAHAKYRAERVVELLTTPVPTPGPDPSPVKLNRVRAEDAGLGRAGDWTAPDGDRDYVDFHVVQDILPGEHGFRFFPSFYRNLFDTMRRIPIADDRAEFHETPNTVLDNIVPTEYQRLGLVETPPNAERSFQFRRHPSASLREAFDLLGKILSSLQCTVSDIAQHQLRLFKYMTSSPQRRAVEYEYQSWYDFMDADNFSPQFREIFDKAGQTNVAVRAAECDARTYGNVSVQLFLDQIRLADNVDGTLNGPTSIAWFDHWRRYLEEQGVIFRHGELTGWLFPKPTGGEPPEPRARVRLWRREKGSHDPSHVDDEVEFDTLVERDFYVVAVPLQIAVGLFPPDKFPQPDFVRLRGFLDPLNKDNDVKDILRGGDANQKKTVENYSWLQPSLAGVQFFLPTDGGFVRGHTSYLESTLRLSSISQPQFWFRRRGWWDGYRGVLSVDIGEWKDAWSMKRNDIVDKVWSEVIQTIYDKGAVPDHYVAVHFDRFIEFDAQDKPVKNHAPYLVTRTGEFPKRPGRLDRRNGYELHFGRIVLAGTYMQTYTRLTTMESANESGRHAANAILAAKSAPVFSGQRCQVHDPEQCEIQDLKLFIELDQRLLAMGLPHFADILDLTEVPFALLCPGANPHELLAQLGIDPQGLKGA